MYNILLLLCSSQLHVHALTLVFPVADMNRTMTETNVNDHKEQEDSGLVAAIIIFSGSLLITLAALVSTFI